MSKAWESAGLHAGADQAGGVHYGVDLVGLDGLDDGRQVAHILARQPIALVAEFHAQEIGARLRIEEDDCFAARDGVLGEGGADQSSAGDQCWHDQ